MENVSCSLSVYAGFAQRSHRPLHVWPQNKPRLHEIIRPKGGECLVKQDRIALTAEGPFRGRSSYLDLLYVVVDTYFTELEWVPIVQWTNLTDSDGTYPQTITTRFATCDSGLAAAHIGLASMMQDLRIRFENVYKSFLAQETTKPLTFDINLNVPPEKSAIICQRR